MSPQPMSEAEVIKCLVDASCIGTVKMTFESGPYDVTRTSINADRLARAIIAARDAQWAAMIGEPVAHLWQHTETGRTRIVTPDMIVTADATWLIGAPLYAIKEPK